MFINDTENGQTRNFLVTLFHSRIMLVLANFRANGNDAKCYSHAFFQWYTLYYMFICLSLYIYIVIYGFVAQSVETEIREGSKQSEGGAEGERT